MGAKLRSLVTGVPAHRFSQAAAKEAARRAFVGELQDTSRLLAVYDHAGIGWRYSCLPLEGHLEERGFGARNALFVEHAVDLSSRLALEALADAGLAPEAVDAVVTVSSTGLATPSLEAFIGERLGLRADVERTPVFGLGCAGGALGLARAARLAEARPGSTVLLLVVEFCTLSLRLADKSKANLVACALFGDGAAAAVLSTEGDGPSIRATGEHRWTGTLEVMGWHVEDDGLGVLFATSIPEIARTRMRGAAEAFLAREGMTLGDLDAFVLHPGGPKVLAALAQAFEVPEAALEDGRAVLHAYGNMSSPTVLFILQRQLERRWRRGLLAAMGPGFTAGFAVIERQP